MAGPKVSVILVILDLSLATLTYLISTTNLLLGCTVMSGNIRKRPTLVHSAHISGVLKKIIASSSYCNKINM